ncbi:hypothetical protein IFR05_000195 [Cadophora sp. M221]|nr:hypothetical protein IFR05_000195 [Cadophora sp. M221]
MAKRGYKVMPFELQRYGRERIPAPHVIFGLLLAHWMSANIMFGTRGCNIKANHTQEATEACWCIAKLHKMRGAKLEGPIGDRYVMEWAIADSLLSQSLVQTLTLREQLEQKKVPPECIEFIEYLLLVDPKKRLSVVQALAHPLLMGEMGV